MKKYLASVFFALSFSAIAQTSNDPVLMRINGQPITRSEFEYSYNKNSGEEGAVEEKSIEEYVDMFVNYKLKVLAAEEARLDTAKSFKEEFLKYRDMQLTPYMTDSLFIDSVCRAAYDQNVEYIKGRDLIYPAHILLPFQRNASDEAKEAIRVKADSIYNAIQQGADFAEMAKKYSQDPQSAQRGGLLGWMVPDEKLKEFCENAYALQKGEISKPFSAAYGYQILKMTDRRPYGTYEEEGPTIKNALLQRGLAEQSAEQKIAKIVKSSNGRLTREAVLDSVLAAHLDNPELKYLVQEYHDGLLLYQISSDEVWEPAKKDSKAQAALFKANKKKYAWKEPRFKGFVVHAKDEKDLKKAAKILKKAETTDWKPVIKQTFNKDSMTVMVSGPYISRKGENRYIDAFVFGGEKMKPSTKFPFTTVVGKKMSQPKSYLDVKTDVENDLQTQREKEWVENLRKKYSVVVDENVLKTVNKH